MRNWNVLVTVHENAYGRIRNLLSEFGPIDRTVFFNVLILQCHDVEEMLRRLNEKIAAEPGLLNFLARLIPVAETFSFQTHEEFEMQAREAALSFVERLKGKSFHVRMHRRGFKGKISTVEEERMLNEVILKALEDLGMPGRLNFDDPDAIVAVETLGQHAGFSLWTREDLKQYPFLRLT
jgi:tRNA(Ser,Leu) C12 N-acetylase TAN1